MELRELRERSRKIDRLEEQVQRQCEELRKLRELSQKRERLDRREMMAAESHAQKVSFSAFFLNNFSLFKKMHFQRTLVRHVSHLLALTDIAKNNFGLLVSVAACCNLTVFLPCFSPSVVVVLRKATTRIGLKCCVVLLKYLSFLLLVPRPTQFGWSARHERQWAAFGCRCRRKISHQQDSGKLCFLEVDL